MSMVAKILGGLVLLLPVVAYAVGTLTSTRVEVPAERTPIVIQDAPVASSPAGGAALPAEGPSGDDDVDVVRPRPDDIDTVVDDPGRDEDTPADTGADGGADDLDDQDDERETDDGDD